MRRSVSILLLIGALGITAGAYARVATGTLAGTVLGANGAPVADATVTIETSFGNYPNATHTNADGRFRFARFRPGQYDLRAYAHGAFSKWHKRVTIHAHRTTEVTLRLSHASERSAAAAE
jgi:protocatechuate 3,4-dioxygenase beta subunit